MRLLVAALAAAGAVVVAAAAAALPGDPQATDPAYAALGMPGAWEIETGSPAVVIAVVDSGVDPTHPDLAGAVLPGYDFVENRPTGDRPEDGHGTAVAGAATARADNGIGGVGTCFRCRVLPLRVLGPGGIAAMGDVARAIDYAVDHGAAVVNVSLYGDNRSDALRAAVLRARAAGVPVIAAAGNEASDVPQYPAAFPSVISVGAATYAGVRSSFSSFGTWVGYAAPECAPVTVLGGGTGVGCMTSTSAPLVAGVVALMRAYDPFASSAEIEAALAVGARSRPVDGIRAGFVDAAGALRALGRNPPRLDPTVLGRAVVGSELEVLTGIWSGSGLRVRNAWERCRATACVPIRGASTSRYRVTRADEGSRLRASCRSTDLRRPHRTRPRASRARRASSQRLRSSAGRGSEGA
jgi:subtilisin family serine protease